MERSLSRLNIVGNLDENAPIIVLEEIATCHLIPLVIAQSSAVAVLVEEARKHPIGTVHCPPEPEDYQMIAQYVNPNSIWNPQELLVAYNLLTNWEDAHDPVPPTDFSFGLQTQNDPHRLNACILYKLCTTYNVPLNRNQSLYQMAHAVYMISRNDVYARSVLYNTILNLSRQNLIELYTTAALMDVNYTEPEEINPINNYDAIESCYQALTNKQTLQARIWPQTYAEAIVLGALNYTIDLSHAQDPITEYRILVTDPLQYKPQDEYMRKIVAYNPALLYLDETFNPLLPVSLYHDSSLQAMATNEGYQHGDMRYDSAYTLLQTAYVSNTFYHGKQLGIINEKTVIDMELVIDLPNEIVVCYGTRDTGNMFAFRYGELAALFNHFRNFNNPLDSTERFSEIAIRKLKIMSRQIRTGEAPEFTAERKTLYDAIVVTELFTEQTLEQARTLYERYTNAEEPIKAKIIEAIWALFYLAMYMRGWLGEGEFPITSAPVTDQVAVDLKVTEGVARFEALCEELQDIGTLMIGLPLLKYKSGEFQAITEERQGRTIGERITIVKSGDDHPNYDSCIRLSSNLFSATTFRYMEILGINPPFDLDQLRNIS